MLKPALRYLTVRSLGSPAVLLSLAMQGVFRGFKDTKTSLFATSKQSFSSSLLIFKSISSSLHMPACHHKVLENALCP